MLKFNTIEFRAFPAAIYSEIVNDLPNRLPPSAPIQTEPPRKVQLSFSRRLTTQSLLQLLLHPGNLNSVE